MHGHPRVQLSKISRIREKDCFFAVKKQCIPPQGIDETQGTVETKGSATAWMEMQFTYHLFGEENMFLVLGREPSTSIGN